MADACTVGNCRIARNVSLVFGFCSCPCAHASLVAGSFGTCLADDVSADRICGWCLWLSALQLVRSHPCTPIVYRFCVVGSVINCHDRMICFQPLSCTRVPFSNWIISRRRLSRWHEDYGNLDTRGSRVRNRSFGWCPYTWFCGPSFAQRVWRSKRLGKCYASGRGIRCCRRFDFSSLRK